MNRITELVVCLVQQKCFIDKFPRHKVSLSEIINCNVVSLSEKIQQVNNMVCSKN